MNLNQFRKKFPNEGRCRKYLEKVIWPSGRVCPHCGCLKSWSLKGFKQTTGVSAWDFRNSTQGQSA